MTTEPSDKPVSSPVTSAINDREAPSLLDDSSPLDAWVQGMVRTQIELSNDPVRHYHASKRGF